MSKFPSGDGACCLPGAKGVTYLRIGPRKTIVGMQALESVFQQLLALGRKPDDVADEEIVGMARKFNYIQRHPDVEANYAVALREEYARYCARQESQREESA
jgi:hypothetical protein